VAAEASGEVAHYWKETSLSLPLGSEEDALLLGACWDAFKELSGDPAEGKGREGEEELFGAETWEVGAAVFWEVLEAGGGGALVLAGARAWSCSIALAASVRGLFPVTSWAGDGDWEGGFWEEVSFFEAEAEEPLLGAVVRSLLLLFERLLLVIVIKL
jgi:hypothetical protein